MKKKSLFIVVNALLVAVIGIIFGLTCGEYLFVNGAGISAFVLLLITLCIPSLLYLYGPRMTVGGRICTLIFILLELTLSIVFMCKPAFGIKAFWITEAIVVALFLAALLVILALFKNSDSKE